MVDYGKRICTLNAAWLPPNIEQLVRKYTGRADPSCRGIGWAIRNAIEDKQNTSSSYERQKIQQDIDDLMLARKALNC